MPTYIIIIIAIVILVLIPGLLYVKMLKRRRINRQISSTINKKQLNNDVLIPMVDEVLRSGKKVILELRGNSMLPFLRDARDKGLLTHSNGHDFKVGDPILAEVDTPNNEVRYVLHRIVKIEGDKITLRGDGNIGIETCSRDKVIATVIGFYRKGRTHLDRIDSMKWRIYSWFWTRLLPIRPYLLAIHRRTVLRFFTLDDYKDYSYLKNTNDKEITINKDTTMRIKNGFEMKTVCGEYMVNAVGEETLDYSNIVSMNESSALLWEKMKEKGDFTPDDMAKALIEVYEVSYEQAYKDCVNIAKSWVDAGLCEE